MSPSTRTLTARFAHGTLALMTALCLAACGGGEEPLAEEQPTPAVNPGVLKMGADTLADAATLPQSEQGSGQR